MGRTHALLLAERGATVVVNGTRADVAGESGDARIAESVVGDIRESGGSAVAATSDISSPDGASTTATSVLDYVEDLRRFVPPALRS